MWTIRSTGFETPPVQAVNRECPHCRTVAHVSAVAVPSLAFVQRQQPKRIGAVFQCDACGAPRFFRFSVQRITDDSVELHNQGQEVERTTERFPFTYLPRPVEKLFREALLCYAADCYNAFASMCRRSMRAAFTDLGESGRLQIYDTLEQIRTLCELDDSTWQTLKNVLFGTDGDHPERFPEVDAASAAVLLETIKDLLYQTYVRRQKLLQAMTMRRFFAEESARKLKSVDGGGDSDRSAGAM